MKDTERFIELTAARFETVRRFAGESPAEAEYYHAILDKRQRGRVFADDPDNPSAVLFWHYAGFGFVAGRPDAAFLQNVLAMVLQTHPAFVSDRLLSRRFVLQQDDPSPDRSIARAGGVFRSERRCFAYLERTAPLPCLPAGFTLERDDPRTLSLLTGDVTPAFSWSSDAEFLGGGGRICCILHHGEPAAWAFAAALGGGRMDIGVETAPPFRGRGLAGAAAAAMVQTALSAGYLPVWGCGAANEASAKTALRAGFSETGRHEKFKKAINPAKG